MALFTALVAFAVIPFGDILNIGERAINLQVANLNVGILYVFAMGSLGVYGIVIGAWASNNKFSLLGGVRGSAQMISYEIAMGLSVMGVLMVYGTLELQEIARGQGALIRDLLPQWLAFLQPVIGWLPAWGIFLQPLAFLLFFTAAVAETKRIPFDLPEGESELVAGYHVEYSGGKFLMFFAGEFAEIVTVAGLVTTLFFGGWQVPYLMREGFHFPWGGQWLLPHLVVVGLQVGAFTLKVLFFCWLQILLRWSVPRFRYDQVMRLGWKMLLPLALINVMITAFVIIATQ
jgi:NADH-quinone oxidoreductase subunit H